MGKPLDIQITATETGLDVDVRGSGPVPSKTIAALSRVAEVHRLARLTRHGELVLMRTPPTITAGQAQVMLPPGSFLQPTVAGEEALAALVADHCKRAKHMADLFCGVGPFALRLARKSRVAAFDNDPGSVAARRRPRPGSEAAQGGGARSVPAAVDAAGARDYAGRVRSAATRRRKPPNSPPARLQRWLRYPAMSRPLRATPNLVDGGYASKAPIRHTPVEEAHWRGSCANAEVLMFTSPRVGRGRNSRWFR
jgi:hypothetical protein